MSHESLKYVFQSLRPEPGMKGTLTPEKRNGLDEVLGNHSQEEVQAAVDAFLTAEDRVWIDDTVEPHEMPLGQFILQRKKYIGEAPSG